MIILVRKDEVPATCCHCSLQVYDDEIKWGDAGVKRTGAYVCFITGQLIDNTKREEKCPLVITDRKHIRIRKNKLEKFMDRIKELAK